MCGRRARSEDVRFERICQTACQGGSTSHVPASPERRRLAPTSSRPAFCPAFWMRVALTGLRWSRHCFSFRLPGGSATTSHAVCRVGASVCSDHVPVFKWGGWFSRCGVVRTPVHFGAGPARWRACQRFSRPVEFLPSASVSSEGRCFNVS